jgi:hypothetical protein
MPEDIKTIICQLAATVRTEREVRRKTFPQFDRETEDEYPFRSKDEMVKSYMFAALDLDAELVNLLDAAAQLPKPYGDMFCYLTYCNLHEQIKLYKVILDQLKQMKNRHTREGKETLVLLSD